MSGGSGHDGNGDGAAPPRLFRWLAARLARSDDRDFLLGDLDEELAERAARDGARAARRWYRAQVLSSVPHLLARRLAGTAVPRADDLGQDVRIAARGFARRPGYTLAALATLTVAIGATTAVFSVANGVLLRAVPGVRGMDRIVEMGHDRGGSYANLSYPLVQAMARGAGTLEAVTAMDWSALSIGGSDRPEVRTGMATTAAYFRVLGVTASRGRLFGDDEATFPSVRPVAVISQRLYADRFADARVPGSTIVVNGVPLTLVGVTAGDFRGHTVVPADVFVPLGLPIPGLHSEDALTEATVEDVEVLARLRPGASAAAAQEEATALCGSALAAAGATPETPFRVRVDAFGLIPASGRSYVAAFLSAMLLLVGIALAMACTNVAGMTLTRAVERTHEIALRAALGAGRGRIVRQLLTEAVLLAVASAALAVPLAAGLGRLLLAFRPPLPPGFSLALDFSIDWRVLGFAFAVAVTTAVAFNLTPALRAARVDLAAAIRGDATSSGRRAWGRSALVAGQMALSLTLLVTAGLFVRSLAAMRGADPGWNADGVWVADLDLELLGTSDGDGAVLWHEILARVSASPAVASAGLGHKLPLASRSSFGDLNVDGVEPPEGGRGFPGAGLRVSRGYLTTLDLALLEGRDFDDRDSEGAPEVAVVNRTMAHHFWPGESAVGKVFHLDRGSSRRDLTIVGVVEDARYQHLFEATPDFYYLPATQWYNAHMNLFVRPRPGREEDVRALVRAVVAELAPALPVEPVAPLWSQLALSLSPQRIAAWVSGVMGVLGLLLGVVGVYGVTSFAVSRRVREIGIRTALGATRGDILGLVLRQGMTAPLAGVGVGLLGAFAVARVVSSFLAGVGVADLAAVGGAVALLLAATLAATFVPAWRASRASTVESLRSE